MINKGKASGVEVLSWELEKIDCGFIGEDYCLSNYETGATIYNDFSDLCYVINFTDVNEVLMKGNWLKLRARKPDEADREILKKERC